MIKRLRKVGSRSALILDKTLLELLGLEEKGLVQLIISNGSLLITPVHPNAVSDEKFKACLAKVMKRYRRVLQSLAD